MRWRQTFGKGRWQVSNAKTYHTSLVTKLVFVRVHGYSRPFIATWVALVDVPPETGFCLVPGSHKSLFQTPAHLPVKHDPPTSITLPMQAGDVAIFSTNLLHDASPWTEDYPRMNIFQRYQLSAYFNESGKGGYPFDEHREMISEEQYELESLSKEVKAAVQRILPNGGEK